MTSLPSTLTARKSTNINFSIDKIYYNYPIRVSKDLQIYKIPKHEIGTLKEERGKNEVSS